MKYKIFFITTLVFLSQVVLGNAAEKEKTNIVYPTWIETAPSDADMSVPNWYLKNYTTIDQNKADNYRSPKGASDQDYRSRLDRLSKRYGMNLQYNDIVKNYIERYVIKNRSQVSCMLGLWPYYKPIFENEISKNKLPEALKYLPVACSALNPDVISNDGAAGLWQFMIAPAKGNGLEVNTIVDERFDPYRSSEKAAEYLKKLYSSYNDWLLAIAAHTCGIGNVNKSIQRAKNQKVNNPNFWDIYKYLPKNSRGYVPAFIAACYAMNYFNEHDITPTLTNRRLVTATTQVTKRVSIHQISQVLGIDQNEIRFLNPQYREEVNDVIVIPGNIRPYTLTLPSGQINSYRIAEDRIANYQKKQFERRAEVQPGDIKSIVGGEEDIDNGIVYHEVVEDEDLESIAKRYGVTVENLKKTNRLTSYDIEPGDIIQINTKGAAAAARGKSKENIYASNSGSNYGSGSNSGSYSNSNQNSNSGRNNNSGYNDDIYADNNTPRHRGSDTRNVPPYNRNKETQAQQNYLNDDSDDSQQRYQEELKRQKEIERKKREAERRRKAEEAAKRKAAEEAAAKKKAAEREAAKKKAAEDAAKRKAAEEAAKRKAAEEAAKRKAAEEAAKPIVHQVKEGNNLTKLAEQYGVSIADIKDANPDLKDENIKIGQKINIPKKSQRGQNAASSSKQNDKQVNTPQNGKRNSLDKDKQQQSDKSKKEKSAGEAYKKRKAEELAKKKAAEEAKKKAEEEAKKKAAEEAKKKAAEEAKRKAAEEAAKKPTHHVVKEGNNLTKLAAQYGVSADDIRKANGITGDNIRIGQKLIIPPKKAGTKKK